MQKTKAEIYAEYIKRDDITLIKNGKTYYRIIYKESYLGFAVIALPREASYVVGARLEDENGVLIKEPGFPIRYEVDDGVEYPEWYTNSVEIPTRHFDSDPLGEYILVIR